MANRIPFVKMHGCGNDFILIDRSQFPISPSRYRDAAIKLCHRNLGIGADGLIVLERLPNGVLPYRWHFYNCDGQRGEMCGNGARCAAWLACEWGWAEAKHAFETDAGSVSVSVCKDRKRVTVAMGFIGDTELNQRISLPGGEYIYHQVQVGVPHSVIFCDVVESLDVNTLGWAMLEHEDFHPHKTNTNFVQIAGRQRALIRTFERGVNAETLACGTGCCASAASGIALGHFDSPVTFTTKSSDEIAIEYDGSNVSLTGPVETVFHGMVKKRNLD